MCWWSPRAAATAARWRTGSACSWCPAALLGESHQGWEPLARVTDRAAVALSAEICGAAQRVLDMTVDYAKLRVAFGKPIGTYQGVKHQCADMLVEIENARSLTYYAAWALDE